MTIFCSSSHHGKLTGAPHLRPGPRTHPSQGPGLFRLITMLSSLFSGGGKMGQREHLAGRSHVTDAGTRLQRHLLEGAQSEVIRAILMLGERIASQSEVIGAIVSGQRPSWMGYGGPTFGAPGLSGRPPARAAVRHTKTNYTTRSFSRDFSAPPYFSAPP